MAHKSQPFPVLITCCQQPYVTVTDIALAIVTLDAMGAE